MLFQNGNYKSYLFFLFIFLDVIVLVFQRLIIFDYKFGQWVRIVCFELGENEYYFFIISFVFYEEYFSFYIRVVGFWIYNFRNLYDFDNLEGKLVYLSVSCVYYCYNDFIDI